MTKTTIKSTLMLGATALLLSATALRAEDNGHGMHGGSMMGKGDAPMSDAAKAYAEANMKMHHAMAMPLSGDADVDFVQGMIPHHQGAIDMAKIELQYGKDPEVRKLAEDVVKAQDAEIAFMRAWLAKRPK